MQVSPGPSQGLNSSETSITHEEQVLVMRLGNVSYPSDRFSCWWVLHVESITLVVWPGLCAVCMSQVARLMQ